jgi:hypothetical protein
MSSRNTTIAILVLLLIGTTQAAESDSLFPKPGEVGQEKTPSLTSAIGQFEDIINESNQGQLETLSSNDTYNQDRSQQLRQALKQKQAYLDAMPTMMSERFASLLEQYPHADQATKNKMAEELHAQWASKEAQVRLDIADLQEQLAKTTNRMSQSAVQRQMLEINSALSDNEQGLAGLTRPAPVNAQAQSPVFESMMTVTRKRLLSKLSEFCTMTIKPMDTEISLSYLDN